MIVESIKFFSEVPIFYFYFGTEWDPSGVNPRFGAAPLFYGTLVISVFSLLIAIPLGILSAIYLSEYSSSHIRNWCKPILEMLAGIPTVVYGYFAAILIGPFIRQTAEYFGLYASTESILSCSIVMGIMIVPYIASLSDDVMQSIPDSQRQSSLALGATKSETIVRVLLPAALPGLIAACVLGMSRAIGETMIVVMASGLAANITANPLEAVTTVTVQIVALLSGDLSYESISTKAAYGLGLTLFLSTFLFNAIALNAIRYYRKKYA